MKKVPAFGHSGFLMESPAALQTVGRRGPTVAAGLLWLAAGLSAGYWVLLAWGRSPVTPVSTLTQTALVAEPAAVARTLGAVPAAAASVGVVESAPPRYNLLGVVAVGAQDGAALIAVGDQPARPYRVGASVDGGLVLQAVTRRAVRLGASLTAPTTVELTLPETATPS